LGKSSFIERISDDCSELSVLLLSIICVIFPKFLTTSRRIISCRVYGLFLFLNQLKMQKSIILIKQLVKKKGIQHLGL